MTIIAEQLLERPRLGLFEDMEDEDNARGPEPEPDGNTVTFWRLMLGVLAVVPALACMSAGSGASIAEQQAAEAAARARIEAARQAAEAAERARQEAERQRQERQK